jgi:hypothetical protein
MAEKPTPNWQPLSKLPLIMPMIDGMLEGAQEQYQTLLEARSKPHVLDDYTVGRVRDVYTAQQDDLWLWEEQLRRWQAQTLTATQQQEVARLTEQVARLREVIAAILMLAAELARGTIERVLAKSDLQVGLEFLLGLPLDHDH